ncbi:hypothetical protein PENSPDRAFT_758344 [Peniophora sp. CONT]|nr:hypothetical protein PENSPDRAFT_758344 [Peniophora sp. CONT]
MSTYPGTASQSARSGVDSGQCNFDELWAEALLRYKKETGKDLLGLSFADYLLSQPRTSEEIVQYIKEQNESFDTFRSTGHKILGVLKPIVSVVLRVIDAGAEGASAAAPGGKAIFVAVAAMLQAANGVSDRYDDIESLLTEIQTCIARVDTHLKPSTPPSSALTDILTDTLVQVFTVLAIVTKYCPKEAAKRKSLKVAVQRAKDYFRGVLGNTDVKDALKSLEKLTKKELLEAAAQTNAIVREAEPRIKFVYDETVGTALRSWLHAPDPQPRNLERKRQTGSCEWFFDTRFEEWKSQQNGVYWVYGNAGAGKSVLCSSVLDALETDPTLSLAYFYFDFSDRDKQDCRALVSSLVVQLGTSSSKCLSYLQEQRRLSSGSPTYDKLLNMFTHLISLSIRPFLVIDALDECPKEAREGPGLGPNKGLLGFLKYLCGLHTDRDDFHLFATSRRETDIEYYLGPLATHRLGFHDNGEHNAELSRYIAAQLSDDRLYLWSKNDALKSLAERILIEKSGGMFLWVNLQLRRLQHLAPRYVEQVLDTLPPGLDETYKQILENFSSDRVKIDRARRVFECVAFAQRPLSLPEAVTIVSANFDTPMADPVELDLEPDIADLGMYLLERCPGLLEVDDSGDGVDSEDGVDWETLFFEGREDGEDGEDSDIGEDSEDSCDAEDCKDWESGEDGKDEDDGEDEDGGEDEEEGGDVEDDNYAKDGDVPKRRKVVRFIHFSAKEYLTSLELKTLISHARQFAVDEDVAHLTFGRMCLSAVVVDGSLPDFQSYADQYWINHISSRNEDALGDLLFRFLYLGSTSFIRWAQGGEQYDPRRPLPYQEYTALHVAAELGLCHYVTRILKTSNGSPATAIAGVRGWRQETALHTAASHQHVEVVRALLEHGALVNDTNEGSETPLHHAAHFGHLDVVCALLNHPAADESDTAASRCRVHSGYGLTPLHQAAQHGHVEVARASEKWGTRLITLASTESVKIGTGVLGALGIAWS